MQKTCYYRVHLRKRLLVVTKEFGWVTSTLCFKTFADFWFSEDPRPRCEIGRSELLLLRRRSDGCGHNHGCDAFDLKLIYHTRLDIVNGNLYNARRLYLSLLFLVS